MSQNREQVGDFYMDLSAKKFTDCTDTELKMILDWRNSEIVSSNSFNKCMISWQEHQEFVKSLKEASDKAYFLVIEGAIPIGVVSFCNITRVSANVGYYKDPNNHNTGVGVDLLTFASVLAKNKFKLSELITEVIKGNPASEKSMERAGFLFIKEENGCGDKQQDLSLKIYKKII